MLLTHIGQQRWCARVCCQSCEGPGQEEGSSPEDAGREQEAAPSSTGSFRCCTTSSFRPWAWCTGTATAWAAATCRPGPCCCTRASGGGAFAMASTYCLQARLHVRASGPPWLDMLFRQKHRRALQLPRAVGHQVPLRQTPSWLRWRGRWEAARPRPAAWSADVVAAEVRGECKPCKPGLQGGTWVRGVLATEDQCPAGTQGFARHHAVVRSRKAAAARRARGTVGRSRVTGKFGGALFCCSLELDGGRWPVMLWVAWQ